MPNLLSNVTMEMLDVRALLRNVQFSGDDDSSYRMAISTAQERKHLVSTYKGETDESKLAAVIEVQRVWRGYRTRRKMRQMLQQLLSDHSIRPLSRDSHVSDNTTALYDRLHSIKVTEKDKRDWVLEMLSGNNQRPSYANNSSCDSHMTINSATPKHSLAVKTNQGWRFKDYSLVTKKARETGNSRVTGSIGHVTGGICHVTGGSHFNAGVRRKKEWTPETAARAVQRAWRSYKDIKVFKYYKDLLNFSGKVDPKQLLRSINPVEGELMDEASGGFVRFRLGGNTFPPSVYYKIFTHSSVVDMCSFSPRDYTAMCERMRLGRDVHNKDPRTPVPVTSEREGWYERVENNGWRPLVNKFPGVFAVVTDSSPEKPAPFHHLKHQRRMDVKVMRKRKKIQWMMQMYKAGMIEEQKQVSAPCVTPSGLDSTTIITPSPTDKTNTVCYQLDNIEEEEIDQLLQWTTQLNYDNYLYDWSQLATLQSV